MKILKRVSQVIGCILVSCAVAYGFFWCLAAVNFPITSVRFIGERKYLNQQDLQMRIVSEVKRGFFRLKVSTLQQQLLSLPWVKKVDIRKIWPDEVVIHFEEHIPAAFWGKTGMLSTMGTLFYPDLSCFTLVNLPLLEGPTGRDALVWQQFLMMEKMLTPLNVRITHLVLAPRGAWHMQLSNGITVVLGTNDVLARVKRFAKAYEKHLYTRKQEVVYVDLRYTTGMAVGWKTR